MICSRCAHRSPAHHKYCVRCGARLEPRRPFLPAAAAPEAARPKVEPSPPAQLDAQQVQQLLAQAHRYRDQGQTEKAIETCHQLLALHPANSAARCLLGILYDRIGQRDKALQEYESVFALGPPAPAAGRYLKPARAPEAQPQVSALSARAVVVGGFALAASCLLAGLYCVINPGTSQAPVEISFITPTAQRWQPATTAQRLAIPQLTGESGREVPASVSEQPGARETRQTETQAPGLDRAAPGPSLPRTPSPTAPRFAQPSVAVSPPRPYVTRAEEPAVPAAPAAREKPSAVEKSTAPVVATPPEIPAAAKPEAPSAQDLVNSARKYFLARNYSQAAASYERALAAGSGLSPGLRQELALCYQQMNDRQQAAYHYTQALKGYQRQLAENRNPQGAKYGIRACQAALQALEAR